ncbi:MAG: substrate-binding domain-containing protein [Candidatus Methanoperedens sp.]|nr:substrate-binding domain-containing protein [Candidatus Methanoperedens sp.]
MLSLFAGCIQQVQTGNTSRTVQEELRLATTTSTCDTGLLDILNKKFEEMNNVKVLTICEGTGRAISRGELGEADVVMAHAVPLELKAVANGSLINRRYMMYNYFVIIGPESDPAGIKSAASAPDVFRRIAAKQSPFISRGDDSGANLMEKSIWETANITPSGTWYQSVDKGMEETINITDAKGGYTLSNKGTYLVMKDKTKLRVLFEGDRLYLFNPYHIMAVNPAKFPAVKYDLAMKYIDYIISPGTQDFIRNYGKDKYGEALFVPAADALEN